MQEVDLTDIQKKNDKEVSKLSKTLNQFFKESILRKLSIVKEKSEAEKKAEEIRETMKKALTSDFKRLSII